MDRQNTERCRRNYDLCRHHAWGGLGFLSLLLALRYIFPPLPAMIMFPLVILLVAYIMCWLILTYRFRSELKAVSPDQSVIQSASIHQHFMSLRGVSHRRGPA